MNPIVKLCVEACEEVAKRIPHGSTDCIAAILAIPQEQIDRAAGGADSSIAPFTKMLKKYAANDIEWLHKFISCVPFGANCPAEDMTKAHEIVNALAAPAALPEGYVMVPREPTKEMLAAAVNLNPDKYGDDPTWTLIDQYKAMIAAAGGGK